MDPPEIQRIKNRFFEIKKTYKDLAWLSPNVRNELKGYAGKAKQSKFFALAVELYVFIDDRKEIKKNNL